jgi:rusticyanin
MTGGSIPNSMMGGSMMGTGHDPGQVMGRRLADARGPRVSASQADQLGDQVPANATVDRNSNTINFSGTTVQLAALASPAGGPDETFRIAGMVNPTIVVPAGANIAIAVVNADGDTAHGMAIAHPGSASSWMPMMTVSAAFSGSAVWALGTPTRAGMHEGTLTFTARAAGTYQYLCPVPGHAQKGMAGSLVINSGHA